MAELIESYATDRYLLRLIRPLPDSTFLLLSAESPGGSTLEQSTLRQFDELRRSAQVAEENYRKANFLNAQQKDKPLLMAAWEKFRLYSGLPELSIEKELREHNQQKDGGSSH